MTQSRRSARRSVRRSPDRGDRGRSGNHRSGRQMGELLGSLRLPPRDVKYHMPEEVSFRAQTLKREHRDDLRLHLLGRSRQGLPLFALQVGSGERVVLAAANLYAREAVGTTSLLSLTQNLLRNSPFQSLCERFTFFLLPQMNPDGMNWNLGWMKTEFSLQQYISHHFRDLPEDAVDYGFPLSAQESVRPEVKAITSLLEHLPHVELFVHLRTPVLSGGVEFGLQPASEQPWGSLPGTLDDTCGRLQLPLAEVEPRGQQGVERLRRGYRSLPVAEAVRALFQRVDADYAEAFRLTTWEYLQRHCDTRRTLEACVPMVRLDGLEEGAPGGQSRAGVEEERARVYQEVGERLEEVLDRLALPPKAPAEASLWLDYYRRLADYYRLWGRALLADGDRFQDLEASRADVLRMKVETDLLQFMPLTAPFYVLRLLDHPQYRRQQGEFQDSFKRRLQSFQRRYRWSYVPLKDQIRLHMAAVLAAASMLEKTPTD